MSTKEILLEVTILRRVQTRLGEIQKDLDLVSISPGEAGVLGTQIDGLFYEVEAIINAKWGIKPLKVGA